MESCTGFEIHCILTGFTRITNKSVGKVLQCQVSVVNTSVHMMKLFPDAVGELENFPWYTIQYTVFFKGDLRAGVISLHPFHFSPTAYYRTIDHPSV